MILCNQKTITDDSFKYIDGIKILDISYCSQLTDKIFPYLSKIEELNIDNCRLITWDDQ